MHTIKEARLSDKIKDTYTEVEEALLPEKEIMPERRDDWKEVNNYVEAVHRAISALPELPLSNRIIQQARSILMRGVFAVNIVVVKIGLLIRFATMNVWALSFLLSVPSPATENLHRRILSVYTSSERHRV